MKYLACVMMVGSALCAGCATRLVDFTLISSKNMELARAGDFKRAQSRVEGTDLAHVIFIIPIGLPNAKEALDRAIESVPGAVALVDGVITSRGWWIPLVYGQSTYVVEGTPLIDPKLAATSLCGRYLVTELDRDGKVKETRSVSRAEYDAVKERLVPVTGS